MRNFTSVIAIMMAVGLLIQQATAQYVPAPGNVKLKLTDSSNLYMQDTPEPRNDYFPNNITGAVFLNAYTEDVLNQTLPGLRSFTAFRITSLEVGGPPLPSDAVLTGVVTFLEVEYVTTDILSGGTRLISLNLGDDESRDHQLAGGGTDPLTGNPTVGRFFLFQNDAADTGDFPVLGGRAGDVDFSTGAGDQTVTSNGGDFFDIDILDNFTNGSLLLTGSMVADDIGGTFSNLMTDENSIDGVSWQGVINSRDVLADGGLWFDKHVVTRMAFKINQFGYDGTAIDPTRPFPGDAQVFAGGWQISSEDPITFIAVPEPSTGMLALSIAIGAAGYRHSKRRRTE